MAAPTPASLAAALANRNFRWILLAIAAVPVGAQYLLRTVVEPLRKPESMSDLFETLKAGGSSLASGADVYAGCRGPACIPTHSIAPYPPLVPWASQALTALPNELLALIGVAAGQACVIVLLVSTLAAVGARDRQFWTLAALAAISWWPVLITLGEGNPQSLIAGLTGVWLLCYVDNRKIAGGLSLGLSLALKPLEAPLLALLILRRRWPMLAVALATWALGWIPAADRLPGYLFGTLPSLTGGTGFIRNQALAGALERLFHPETIYYQAVETDWWIKSMVLMGALAVVMLTGHMLAQPALDWEDRRRYEAAVALGAVPLLTSLVFPNHLMVELIPLAVVAVNAANQRRWLTAGLVVLAWALMGLGPVLALSVARYFPESPALQPLADSALAGMILVLALLLFEGRRSAEVDRAGSGGTEVILPRSIPGPPARP